MMHISGDIFALYHFRYYETTLSLIPANSSFIVSGNWRRLWRFFISTCPRWQPYENSLKLAGKKPFYQLLNTRGYSGVGFRIVSISHNSCALVKTQMEF